MCEIENCCCLSFLISGLAGLFCLTLCKPSKEYEYIELKYIN